MRPERAGHDDPAWRAVARVECQEPFGEAGCIEAIVPFAYRRTQQNCAVGGPTRPKHMEGAALDIAMTNHEPLAFEGEVGWSAVR